MSAPSRAADEDGRLAALHGYRILDTPREPALDELTELAAAICAAPISVIALIDESRQWFKSRVGLELSQTPRDIAFCAHVLDQRAPLVVPDATLDPRFVDNPLVTGTEQIRFYAGAPLSTADGHVLGALCVMDRVPRTLTEAQMRGLTALSRQVMTQLEVRQQTDELQEREQRLQESEERFSRMFYSSPTAHLVLRLRDGAILDVNDAFVKMSGHLRAHCLGRTVVELGLIPADLRAAFRTLLTSSGSWAIDGFAFKTSAGEERLGVGSAEVITMQGEPCAIATFIDATELRRAEVSLRQSEERLRLALEAAHMGTFDWDIRSGRITWSRGHEEIWGLQPGTFGGTYESFVERLHPADRGATDAEVARCLAAREPFEREFRVVWPDGSVRWVHSRGEFDFDEGTAVRMRGVVQDITERRATEASLRENELRFEEAQRHAGIGSWRYFPDGTLVWSDQMYELLPLPRGGPLTYDRFAAVIHPGDRSGGVTEFERALQSGAREYEADVRVVVPDGRIRIVHSRGTLLRDASGQLIEAIGTAQDVTERRHAEARIRQLNRVYAMLGGISEALVRETSQPAMLATACRIAVDTGGFVMALIGLLDDTGRLQVQAHAGADGGALRVFEPLIANHPPAGCRFTTDALRTGRHAICHDIAADPERYGWRREALARGYRSMVSLPLVSGGRPIGVFDIYAGDVGVFDEQEVRLLDDVASDISFALDVHRRDAERRAAEERFRLVVENIHEVFWISDAAGDFEFVSPAYETIWGRPRQELYESAASWLETIYPEDRERMEEALRHRLETGASDDTYRIVRPDGTIRWIRARSFPVRNAEGQLHRLVGTAADVTDQRQLEEQFRQAQKMESIGRLAGGIAHDFNNLLTVINGTAELAALDLPRDTPFRGDLVQIRQAGDRAAGLTRQLLALSRQQILKPVIIDLTAIVRGMESMLRRLISEHVELSVVLPDVTGYVKADPGQIEQVILNLAVNAQDAMPDGGLLTIETGSVYVDPADALTHLSARPGPHMVLAISDTGVGMDAATRERIFEPFFTTKELGKGTGLGLSTVYGIVRQSDGGLYVDSTPGHGTTVKVYLPQVDEAPAPPAPGMTGDGGGSETVLLVEDETALRTLTKRILASAGYTVIEAGSGHEALEVLASHQGPVHLMLTDVVMPGMSGRDLALRIAERRPDIKVLYASGYTDDAIFRHGVLDDSSRFISKPFSPAELRRKIREVLG